MEIQPSNQLIKISLQVYRTLRYRTIDYRNLIDTVLDWLAKSQIIFSKCNSKRIVEETNVVVS